MMCKMKLSMKILLEEIEEEYVSKCGSITWKSIPSESNEERKSTLVNRCPRFNVNLNSIKTPKDAFLLYLDYSIIDLICKYTNAEGSHNPKLMKVERDELLTWIGILLASGKNHDSKTHVREMWSSDEVTVRVFYSAVMSRDRYADL